MRVHIRTQDRKLVGTQDSERHMVAKELFHSLEMLARSYLKIQAVKGAADMPKLLTTEKSKTKQDKPPIWRKKRQPSCYLITNRY